MGDLEISDVSKEFSAVGVPIVGRRKTCTARVCLTQGGKNFVVNGKKVHDYFRMDTTLVKTIKEPLSLFEKSDSYDIKAVVRGGGVNSQAEAIRLAIARFLVNKFPDHRATLRQNGLLTRDPRKKERRKPGKLKARKSYAFVKR